MHVTAEEPTDIVLECLQRVDRKIDKIGENVSALKTRMIAIEGNLAGLHVQASRHGSEIERINRRLDRI